MESVNIIIIIISVIITTIIIIIIIIIVIVIVIILIVIVIVIVVILHLLVLTLLMKAVDMSRCAICMDPRLTLPENRKCGGETEPWLFTYSHDILTLALYTQAG